MKLPEIVQENIWFIDDNPILLSILFETIITFIIAMAKDTTCKNVVILYTPL